ncbi:hypothetical protein OF83DRAFT_1063636 [Amylostereum chailletii]|nr:hypothetical protein OF83DRAFT_1063636 [Amylostereum chailletii]
MATPSTSSRPPPSLHEATDRSTVAWQADLESLFHLAKDRFPDVLWDLVAEGDEGAKGEEVWGHKGTLYASPRPRVAPPTIVYARAPPTFQARYFSFRPPPLSSPRPYSPNAFPTQSAFSLSLGIDVPGVSRSPSPFRPASPVSTTQGGITRLTTSINPTLFSKELEYLYTGKGFGEAFEFLFDSSEHYREEGDAAENRVDKLRKDLVFMWRSRLYSDVRIAIEGSTSSNHEGTAAVFTTHRFMLVSRSSYFHNALITWGISKPSDSGEQPTLTLPSPPFTPPALHFILGFIYTGTLIFSNRTYDLDTAFAIMRSSTYVSLDTLYDEVQARIVQEMMHGLFHAFLEFSEYENVTGGKWGTGGCRCRQCARRVPRVIEFAILDDVKNPHLERGARRALVGLFGEGWCNPEFAKLDKKIRDTAMKGVAKRTTPLNVFQLLSAANLALTKLDAIIDPWADVVRDMILDARKVIDNVLTSKPEECFDQEEWVSLMETDGVRFDDEETLDQIMKALHRGFNDKTAALLYQGIVSSILVRQNPSAPGEVMLSSTSRVKVQAEQTRVDLVRWMRKRWISIRQEGGFDELETWALKELSDELDIPLEELNSSATSTLKGTQPRNGHRSTVSKPDEGDSTSLHSLRANVLNRNMAKHHVTSPNNRDTVMSSASSIRSVARSTHSTRSATSTISRTTGSSTAPRRTGPSLGPRPDSKLTPSGSSISRVASPTSSPAPIMEEPLKSSSSSIAGSSTTGPPVAKRPRVVTDPPTSRPKSSASSIASARSRASTVRKNNQSTPTPSIRVPSIGRPISSASTASTSQASSAFKSTKSEFLVPDSASRPRKTSAASSVSTTSIRTTGTTAKQAVKRPPSSASGSSALSTPTRGKKAGPPALDSTRLPPTTQRTTSTSSSPSTSPVVKKAVVRKVTPTTKGQSSAPSTPGSTIKGKGKPPISPPITPVAEEEKTLATPPSGKTSPSKSLQRKSSTDTITRSTPNIKLPLSPSLTELSPRGATLEIGIPCIIASKRARFRAFARYIGEVEGESGPWVGVEVPMGDAWPGDKLDRQWHDGTWGGVRYFDLGNGSEWGDYGDNAAARRRRMDHLSTLGRGTNALKREGEQLHVERAKRFRSVSPAVSDVTNTESRGLFVRPQQVLYVVDAVGSDL